MRVLVVDDSAAVRRRLVSRLEEAGLTVVGEAATAEVALATAAAVLPDAVVLDLQLPDRSGLDILPTLKALDPPPIVLVLTNTPDARYRSRALASGADFFLDKSVEFDAIADKLLGRG